MSYRIATLPKIYSYNFDENELSENDTMGKRIRKLRRAKGLTAEKLGELIGYSAGGLRDLERDRNYPHRDTIIKLKAILGEDLLCDDYSKFIITDYGNNIKAWRRAKGLKYKDAAGYFGISESAYYKLVNLTHIINRKRFELLKPKLFEILK